MYQKNSDSKNFFKTLGVGDLWVPSVSDFAGESPLYLWANAEDFEDELLALTVTNLASKRKSAVL